MTRPFPRPALAILLGALALACAERGSNTMGPADRDMQARKTHANRDVLVTVTVSSSILNGTATDRAAGLGSDGGSSIDNVPLTVSQNDCSLDGDLAGAMGIVDVAPDGERTAGFWFPVPKGSPRWKINFSGGSLSAGVWPPANIGESATWTFTAWELVQESPRGGHSVGACPLNGGSSTITIEKTGDL